MPGRPVSPACEERCLTVVKEKALSASFAPGGQYCHTQQEDRGIEERKHNTVQDGGEVVSFWRHWVLVALLNLVTAIQLVTGGSTRVRQL